MEQFIRIRGARQHNLKNLSVDIPKNKLVVFTGLSGSGKSSLAFDTIYAEGQRRYVESLSAYARQFLGVMDKPDVDAIDGLSPAISIDQKSTSHNPRSTVGTVTEIYDYLRLLFARIGHPHCPKCGREIARQSVDQIVEAIIKTVTKQAGQQPGSLPLRYMLFSPVVRDRKGEFSGLFDNLRAKGFSRIRLDGRVVDLSVDLVLIKTNKHTVEVVIDTVSLTKANTRDEVFMGNLKSRLSQAVEQATNLSNGLVVVAEVQDSGFAIPAFPRKFINHLFSELFACPVCNLSLPEIEPRSFSFNSPHGACPTCTGIGSLLKIDQDLVFNPNLTIAEGGILPYAKMFFHETWWSRVITTICAAHQIDLRSPIHNLSKQARHTLLYGTGDRVYQVTGENRFGKKTQIYESFPGIIADLEKRYSQTESEFIRYEIEKFMRKEVCPKCNGARLKPEALSITVNSQSIVEITNLGVTAALKWAANLPQTVTKRELTIALPILKEIKARLEFLTAVGLEYLTLGRAAVGLSGGEAQRIRLASQIGSGLSGVLYVLDEPSIGLHPWDNAKLISTLKKLRDLGNTVIVVEHDREIMEAADRIFDFGPVGGDEGGRILFAGTPQALKRNAKSATGIHLKDPTLITLPKQITESSGQLRLVGASFHNLKQLDVTFPLGKFICVTGVSGSGKSSLVVDTLYQSLKTYFYPYTHEKPGTHEKLLGLEQVDKVVLVDQSPIGRTPRSNPATYTGLFTHVRDLFAQIPDSKTRGYKAGRFSFNVKGGRCEACEGEGQIRIEMQFLADVYVVCEVCRGQRYNSETLEVRFKGKNISEVLNMTVAEAVNFFTHHPGINERLTTLSDVGLTYIHLGQPAPTLSGGEAQRVKLATELTRRQTGKTVYILDEPTTGLHFADLLKLLRVLKRLTANSNTVVVIEHNLDVVKNADYIIDLGPHGGDRGGYLVAAGSPRDLTHVAASYTGKLLKKIIG